MKQLSEIALILLSMLFAWAAYADPMGPRFIHEEIQKESLPVTDAPISSTVFSAEEGEGFARTARVTQARRARDAQASNTEYCFGVMREAADAGECSASFFAEDASCNGDQEATGCFENRFFKRKLSALGFRVRRKELPTDDESDHCAAITVAWCRDLRKGR